MQASIERSLLLPTRPTMQSCFQKEGMSISSSTIGFSFHSQSFYTLGSTTTTTITTGTTTGTMIYEYSSSSSQQDEENTTATRISNSDKSIDMIIVLS